MNNDKSLTPLDTATFLRVRKWYLLALATIALSIIFAQMLIQNHLNSQLDDSKVINIAGRQRAYSQKLTKEVLLLKESTDAIQRAQVLTELAKTLSVWKDAHQTLQFGDMAMGISKAEKEKVSVLFENINPYYSAMVSAVEQILSASKEDADFLPNQTDIDIILKNEGTFLAMMDNIVNQYDALSKTHLQNLKLKEYLLLTFSMLILLLEIIFIFKPLSLQIRNTIKNLMIAQRKTEESAREIKKLFREKEKSLQELQELNFVIDNAALFASAQQDGHVVFISKKFNELLGRNNQDPTKPLYEMLTTDEGQQQYLREVLKSNRKSIRTEEINIKTPKGELLWLDMSIIPMHQSSAQQSILILCSDITERKKNQLKVAQLTKENYEESMRQKQLQASQIVEGQEEERKRIAKDIHDGIGQMLTALKFNIESINLSNKEKTAEKIEYIKSLASDLIKGVRTATFNLTPPELSDHGLFPALQKMTHELSKLTGKNILFENRTEVNIRFNSLAETNIYRVVQEAVNNAIKYAEANYILVAINFNNNILSVVIDDDGKGFDDSILGKEPKNTSEGGMGLFFMKERMSYINGRLFINSAPGGGTRVTINYKTEGGELIAEGK